MLQGSPTPTHSITALSDGWYRCQLTFTTTSAGSATTQISLATSSSFYTGDGTSGVYIWGAQLEANASFPTSYIPTSGSTVTRSPDIASIEGNKFAKTNLLEYSERFDQSGWVKQNGVVVTPNVLVAPDGTQTSDGLTRSATNQYLYQVNNNPGTLTFSCWVKVASGTASFKIQSYSGTDGTQESETKTATTEWKRFNATFTTTVSNNFYPCVGGVNTTFYIWGAQLETGDELTEYTPSVDTFVSRASTATYVDDATGLITTAAVDAARYENGELLLEPARTNVLPYSEEFDQNVWQKYRASVAPNSSVAPDGTLTADKIIEDVGTSEDHIVNRSVSLASTTYSYSFYAKAGGRSALIVSRATANQTSFTHSFTLEDSGTATGGGSIVALSNGWYRCSGQTTLTNTGSGGFAVRLADSSGNTIYNGDGTSGIYLWGAQLEAAPYASSYIPTTGSTVTRAADVSTSALGVDSWYNQSEGTVFVELGSEQGGVPARFQLSDDSGVNRIQSRKNQLYCFNGTQQFNLSYTSSLKEASAVSGTSTSVAASGSVVATHGSASLPTCTNMELGKRGGNFDYLNGHISRLAYFPTRKTDQELIDLTT